MDDITRFSCITSITAFLLILSACGGGGGGSSTTTTTTSAPTTVTGTAATGAPIASSTVTLKDADGDSATGTTDAAGDFSIVVTDLTPPFLLRIVSGGTTLYSVTNDVDTVANIHPLTDLIVRTWYEVQGDSIDTAFADTSAAELPTETEIAVIETVIENLIEKWLVDAGLDPDDFDLISTPFDANQSGFDAFLDTVAVDTSTHEIAVDEDNDGISEQVTTLDLDGDNDGTSGDVTTTTTTTINGITSTSFTSLYVPTSTAESEALTGVLASLANLASVVNTKGANLTGTDLLALFDDSYLQQGRGKTEEAASFASDFTGTTFESFVIDHVVDFDSTNNIMSIAGLATFAVNGSSVQEIVEEEGDGLVFKKQSDGSWLLYGNQERVRARINTITERRSLGTTCSDGCDGVYYALEVQIGAPAGEVSSATLSGLIGGSQQTLSLTKKSSTFTDEAGNSEEHFDLEDSNQWFYRLSTPDQFPPAGTVYTFNVTFVDTTTATYTRTLGGSTSESFNLRSEVEATVGHSVSSLGTAVTLSWDLPVTFAIENVEIRGSVSSSNGTISCDVDGPDLATDATTGTITLPTTCGGVDVQVGPGYPSIKIVVEGTEGQKTDIWYAFQ